MFNPVGSRIWEMAEGILTVEEIAHRLTEEFAVDLTTAQAQVEQFVNELAAKGLLTLSIR